MIDIERVITEVSNNLDVDRQLVSVICKHPFKCTTDVMKNPDDYRDILFNEMFRFKLKGRFKENKTKQYSPKL